MIPLTGGHKGWGTVVLNLAAFCDANGSTCLVAHPRYFSAPSAAPMPRLSAASLGTLGMAESRPVMAQAAARCGCPASHVPAQLPLCSSAPGLIMVPCALCLRPWQWTAHPLSRPLRTTTVSAAVESGRSKQACLHTACTPQGTFPRLPLHFWGVDRNAC